MSAAWWLAARELAARWGRASIAAAVVAVAAGLVWTVELLSLQNEGAIARELDAAGPSIVIRPAEGGPAALPAGTAGAVARALGTRLRRSEARLVLDGDGNRPPVVGVGQDEAAGIPARGALAGAALMERGKLDDVEVAGRRFRNAGPRPTTATAEDLAVFVRLEELQEALASDAVNELRLYLAPGVDARGSARSIEGVVRARVSRIDRGEVAETALPDALARHRLALYGLMALVAGLCLLIAAHLDAAERRTELATLASIGAPPGVLLWAVLARSLLIASAGAVLGIVGSTAAVLVHESASAATILRAGSASALVLAGAVAVSVAAAIPTAVACARRDPVLELQDSHP